MLVLCFKKISPQTVILHGLVDQLEIEHADIFREVSDLNSECPPTSG